MTEVWEDCRHCSGSGQRLASERSMDDWLECDVCGGTGGYMRVVDEDDGGDDDTAAG